MLALFTRLNRSHLVHYQLLYNINTPDSFAQLFMCCDMRVDWIQEEIKACELVDMQATVQTLYSEQVHKPLSPISISLLAASLPIFQLGRITSVEGHACAVLMEL